MKFSPVHMKKSMCVAGRVLGAVWMMSALMLAGCGNSNTVITAGSSTIAGSVGDGPVTGGRITVTDANGRAVITTPANPRADGTAHYKFTVPSTTPVPLTVTMSGGADQVTGRVQDFDLTAVNIATLRENGALTLNLSPLSTLTAELASVKGALNAANLASAAKHVLGAMGFGLAANFDPGATKVDTGNIAKIIKANEAVAELIRRARVSTGKTMPNTIRAIAEDLTDGVIDGKAAAGVNAMQSTKKTAGVILVKQAEVVAESLCNQLRITDDQGLTSVSATGSKKRLNDALLVTQPDVKGDAADISRVKVTQALIDEARNAISRSNLLVGGNDAALNNLEARINQLKPGAAAGGVEAADICNAATHAAGVLKTATDDAKAGTNTNTVSAAAGVSNKAPVFKGSPVTTGPFVISSNAEVDSTLSLGNTLTQDADGDNVTVSWQWYADGVAITGATEDTYVVQTADVGKKIAAVITVDDGRNAVNSATSVITAPVVAIPQPVANQAMLGPLAQANVDIYSVSDLSTVILNTTTDNKGRFSGQIASLADQDYILIAVSGGQDMDANDDGFIDASPTPNTGAIYALATVAAFNQSKVKVTALSDIVWRYTKSLVNEVDGAGLKLRADDLAKIFIAKDIDKDGMIDNRDVLAFNPRFVSHKAKLNFRYQALFKKDVVGESVIDAYHLAKSGKVDALLEGMFGNRLTRFPVMDSRYKSVKLEVIPLGDGFVSADSGGISFDFSKTTGNITRAFFPVDPNRMVTLTATPVSGTSTSNPGAGSPNADTEILGWNGCDTVSVDKTTCRVSLSRSRQVEVSFGYTQTLVDPGLVDLSRAATTFDATSAVHTINVIVNKGDDPLVAKLESLITNGSGFVVGAGVGGSFLEKVTSITKVSKYEYNLTSVDAALDEVIQQGTAMFSKQMTNGDLASGSAPAPARSVRTLNGVAMPSASAPVAFTSNIPGVRLIPSADPNDEVFHIQFGDPGAGGGSATRSALKVGVGSSLSKTVTLQNKSGSVTANATGSIGVKVGIELAAHIGWFLKLKEIKAIASVDMTQALDFNITGEGAITKEKKIGTLKFSRIKFFIGPVPVWITPSVDLFLGAEATIKAVVTTGITFAEGVRAGIKYKSGKVTPVKEFTKSANFTPPQMTAEGEVKGFIKPALNFLVYDFAGPTVSANGNLSLKAKVQANSNIWTNNVCTAGIDLSLWAGIGSELDLTIKVGSKSKVGKLLDKIKGLIGLPIPIYEKEWLLKDWNINGGQCNLLPALLQVDGSIVDEVVTAGGATQLTQNYTVSNRGDLNMDWTAATDNPGIVMLSSVSGTLSRQELGQTATVTTTVDTGSLTPRAAPYRAAITFTNKSHTNKKPPAYNPETISFPITIAVFPGSIAAPVGLSATLLAGGFSAVTLTWDYTDTASIPFVKEYRIEQSTDGGSTWSLFQKINNIGTREVNLSVLPATNYSFRIAALGDNNLVSPFSPVATIVIPAIPGGGAATAAINDTGITVWGNANANNLTAADVNFPGQDADFGRDALASGVLAGGLTKTGAGNKGFDFTKLDSTGATLADAATAWSCVRDNVTGLTWEVKTPAGGGGLHDAGNTYTWYNSTGINDGGNAGVAAGGVCNGSGCDTEKFVAAVNAEALCGFTDWRLPGREELRSIVDLGASNFETGHFPNGGGAYWSATPYASTSNSAPTIPNLGDGAWEIFASSGRAGPANKKDAVAVRLVR